MAKGNEKQTSRRNRYLIPLHQIVSNHNTRNPPSDASRKAGYQAFDSVNKLSLWELSCHPVDPPC